MIQPLALITLGAILGVAYGYLEAVEVTVLGLIPGILAWRTGNSANVLWFAPAFYAATGAVMAIPFAVLQSLAPRRQTDSVMVFAYAWAGAFLGASLAEGVLAYWSLIALSLGLAVVVVRLYRDNPVRARRLLIRASPILVAGIPLLALGVITVRVVRERMAMSRNPAPADGAPNVVFLVLDTQRADHLSGYGYARPTSPSIDAIAAEGVLYENAFSPSSWTLPSHASFFTGRLPQEHRAGVMQRPYLDRAYPTVAEAFRSAGYATGGFVANGFWCGRQTRVNRGFIRYEDFYGGPGDAVARTALGRRAAFNWIPRFRNSDYPGRKSAERVNADFLDWMTGLEGRPFFAFLNYFDVHGPLLPPPPYEGRFAGRPVRREKGMDIGALSGDMPLLPDSARREKIDRYDESLLYLDAQIGRLVEELRRRGVLERTILVMTSDHGESFGERNMLHHGHSMFREQIHVPLIIRYPDTQTPGLRLTTPVGTERIASTLLTMAGLPREGFGGEPLPTRDDDESFSPVVGGVSRRSATPANWPSSRGWVTSVVTRGHHFLLNEDGTAQVYALTDRDQSRDLSRTPELADSVRSWVAAYKDLWNRHGSGDRTR